MHYIRTSKTMVLVMLLTVVFLALSASTSSCDTGIAQTGCAATDYHCMARVDAINAGIPVDKFETQIQVESGFQALNKWGLPLTSPAGAIGIAQIIPSTAAEWHVDATDPAASLKAAANAMAWYQNNYGSYDKALGCYNAGCSWVVWASQNCSYWLNCMPAETRHYVNLIMGY